MAGYTAFQTDFYTQGGQLAFQYNAFQIPFWGIQGDAGPDAVPRRSRPLIEAQQAKKPMFEIDDVLDRVSRRRKKRR